MGNCVPSNIDPHSLVESPRKIRRPSRTSYPTHETCTTGDGDSSSLCSLSQLDVNPQNSNRLLKIHSSSHIFTRPRSRECEQPIVSKSSSDCELKSRTVITAVTITETAHHSQNEGMENLAANVGSPPYLLRKSSKILVSDINSLSKPSKSVVTTTPKLIPKNNSFTAKTKISSYTFRGASSLSGRSPEDSGLGSLSACTLREAKLGLRDLCKYDIEKIRGINAQTDINDCMHTLVGSTDTMKHTCDQMIYESIIIPPIPPKSLMHNPLDTQTRKFKLEPGHRGSKNKISTAVMSTNLYEEWNTDVCKPKFSLDSSDINDGNRMSPVRFEFNYDQSAQNYPKCRPILAIVLNSFIKKWPHQLSVTQKERLVVLSQQPLSHYHLELNWDSADLENEWWLVEKIDVKFQSQTGRRPRRGFVPSANLQIKEHLPLNHEAWMDIDRSEADRLLLLMGNPAGTYILRSSSDLTNTFALSVRCFDQNSNIWLVKHYRVRYRIAEGLYHIFRRSRFPTVEELISYHAKYAGELACRLHSPCPKFYEPPSTLIQLEVNRSSFRFVKRLGRGSFGEVWQALWNKRVPVAIKKLLGNGNMETTRFLEEARLMHQLNHPRIVRLLAVCTKPASDPVYIVTELMERSSLKNYMQHLDSQDIQYQQMIEMMRDVSEGMVYLEQQHFIHRDLRASNVLVDAAHQLKVADFGLAHMLGDTDEYIGNMQTKFPIRWTAPEGMLKHAYTTKSDVWSFGILIHEILTFCEIPYKALSSREVKEQVCSGYRLPRPSLRIPAQTPKILTDGYEIPKSDNCDLYICPNDLYAKMLDCWQFEPEDRPDFKSLHSFLDEMTKNLKLTE